MEHSTSNSMNLVIHNANGQQQLIKIMRNPNGQPLTQEGVKAIVKEVTGQDASKMLGKSLSSSSSAASVASSSASAASRPFASVSSSTDSTYQQQPARVFHESPASASSAGLHHNYQQSQQVVQSSPAKTTAAGNSIRLSNQQMTSVKYHQKAGSASKMPASSSSTVISSPTIITKKSRRRKTDRVGKGLRHFSMKVCEKVKEKGTTTYNEVADELVEEFCSQEAKGQPVDPANYDQKNIRRRVYDALNVLMAMNIISKDKKEIRWIGLPTNSAQQCTSLEVENQTRKERIEDKQQQLRELILQQVSFKSLVTRNRESEERGLVPSPTSAIQMPFIIVNTHKKTNINCSISSDKSEYHFKFDDKFEIHDDIEVLKRMGLLLGLDTGECTFDDIERAKSMVPKTFEKYIEIYGRGEDEVLSWQHTMLNDSDLIMKTETMSDEEGLDDDQYTDSDIE